jgi:prepilin-type N-terminal cleavage/methylation domain-containing protein
MKKMIKVRSKQMLKDQKGMTLIELIVAMIISAIILALSGGYIISSMNLFNHVSSRGMDSASADEILSVVSGQVEFAESITVLNTVADATAGSTLLYVGDASGAPAADGRGYLWLRRTLDTTPINVFGEAFYHRNKVEMNYTVDLVDETKVVTISINFCDEDGDKSTPRAKTVRLLNALPIDPDDPLAIEKPPLKTDEGKTYPNPAPGSLILQIETPTQI